MMYQLEGTVNVVLEAQTFGSGFTKREIVVTTDEQYPQEAKLEFVKDAIEQLDGLKKGDAVKVSFALSGREWTSPSNEGKYFTNLKGLSISKLNAGEKSKTTKASTVATSANDMPGDDGDDLPF